MKVQKAPGLPVKILLGILALCFMFPLLLTFTGSFMDGNEIAGYFKLQEGSLKEQWVELKLIPEMATMKQYYTLLIEQYKYLNMFWNSVKFALLITVGQLAVASMTAYAFAKLRFKGRDCIFFIYIVSMMMPFQVTMVPNYIMLKMANLTNTDFAVILPGIFAPFGVFLLRQFMRGIPDECLEAATVDGAGDFLTFRKVVLPMSVPGMASLGVLSVIDGWNMVEQPLIFLEDPLRYPLSLSLNMIVDEAKDVAFAGSFIYMIPMLLLYMYFREYIITGINTGQIK